MREEQRKGFTYHVGKQQITEYSSWPIERRLQWLLMGNKLRKMLPKKAVEIQEGFRQGKI